MPARAYNAIHTRPSFEEALRPLRGLIAGVHPACEAVPQISDRDFDNLVHSVQECGLIRPVEIDANGLLVHGRCRIHACHLAHYTIKPKDVTTTQFGPYIIASTNLWRRHLTDDQKAMTALALLDMEEERAKQRKAA